MSFSILVILQYKSHFFPVVVLHMVAMEIRVNYITQERRTLNDLNYLNS